MKKRLRVVLLLCLIPMLCACAKTVGMPEDGQYTIAVALYGGSGRASVESPALLTVQNGQATAVIVWSSPFYEWMELDGVRYAPTQTEGNSTFAIPITLDADMPVSAQTVAMSEPHVVAYTLRFDSSTIETADGPCNTETTE